MIFLVCKVAVLTLDTTNSCLLRSDYGLTAFYQSFQLFCSSIASSSFNNFANIVINKSTDVKMNWIYLSSFHINKYAIIKVDPLP
jgi:hypothetical protein